MKSIIKISSSLAVLVLAVCMSMCVVSCGDDDEDELIPENKTKQQQNSLVGVWSKELRSGGEPYTFSWCFFASGEGIIKEDEKTTAKFNWMVVSPHVIHFKIWYYAGGHASRDEYSCYYYIEGNTLTLDDTDYKREP